MKDDPILMSNNTDLIARLRERADALPSPGIPSITTVLCREAADALAARDAACGHLSNGLVAKALAWIAVDPYGELHHLHEERFTDDEMDALRAAIFKVTE